MKKFTKKTKRMFALLLSVVMVVGLLPATAFASIPLTITAKSATKMYDGTELTLRGMYTSEDGEFEVSGLVSGDTVDIETSGTITHVGTANNEIASYKIYRNGVDVTTEYNVTTVPGTLEVTKREGLTITADSDSKMYDGTPLTDSGYTANSSALVAGSTLTVTVTGSITDAGTAANKVTDYTIYDENGEDVTSNYKVTTVDGTLEVTKRDVTLTSASDSKVYDGQALTNYNVAVSGDGFAGGEGAFYTVTGTQTAAGSSANTFTYELNDGTKAGNYEIHKVEGSLTVEAIEDAITITANSAEKTYDGTELKDEGYTYTQGVLLDGDVLTAEVEGSITDAGEIANKVTGWKIMRGDVDVTASYININTVDGTLTVSPREITFTSASDTKQYDCSPLTAEEVTVTGEGFGLGDSATYTFTGSQTAVGSSKNTFEVVFDEGTKAENYKVIVEYGTLTVARNLTPITITANSNTKVYDGTELTDDGFTFTGGEIYGTDKLEVEIVGAITDAGEIANEIKGFKVLDAEGKDITNYYTFEDPVDGLLTVEQSPEMTITVPESDTWLYSDEIHYGEATSNINDGNTVIEVSLDEGVTWSAAIPVIYSPGTYHILARATNKNYVTAEDEFTFVINEGPQAGFAKDHDVWGYYRDGKLAKVTGFFTDIDRYNETGKTYRYYVVDGQIDFSFTAMAETDSVRYYENGRWMCYTTGAVKVGDDYYYVERGVLKANFEGLVKVDGAWRYFRNGQWQKAMSGYVTDKTRTNQIYRYRIVNGLIDWSFTGAGEANNGRYYKDGRWMCYFTGVAKIDGQNVNVKAGYIQ